MNLEMYDSFCTIIGFVAIGIGVYELLTKKLVGRELEGISEDRIARFLPYDVATYIVAGVLMALLGLGSKIPFMQNGIAVAAAIVLSLATIAFNAHYANKILGKTRNIRANRLRK